VTPGYSEQMETRWLDAREMAAWRAFIETTGDLSAALERDLSVHGLTLGDYQVLVYLSEADDGAMRMCDLADVLQLSPSGLTRRLDGLVTSAQVTRRPSASDGRVMMAVLTDEGRAMLTRTAPHHVASVRRHIFDHLTDQQVDAMASIFEAISAGLESDGDSADSDVA
jgi:DNA-binding MarR family transcriptional regulator